MLLSVIIPVYNSEKYIKECINSVLNQTYKNIEIIVVDDGSTDNSVEICKSIKKNDDRLRIITKKNGGTSSARNLGIKKSKGDYITFIDNDDYWDYDKAIEEIMGQLNETKADVLLFNTKNYYVDTNSFSLPKNRIKREKIYSDNSNEFLKRLIENQLYYRAVWTKVIKSSLIKNNNIYFEEGRRNEDTDFSAKIMIKANSYDYYDKVFHVYRKGHDTAQTSKVVSLNSLNDLEYILKKYIKQASNMRDEELKKCIYSYLAYPFCVWMGQVGYFKEKNEKIKEMKKYSYVIKYDLDSRVKLTKRMCRLIGFKNTCYLLYVFMRLKYRKRIRC